MSRFGWAEPLVDRTPEAARPQPWDCSLLWGENKHRASLVWRDPQACKALKLRQRSSALTFHPQYETFFRECGLYTVVSLLGQSPCKELVTALLERWRPETNTFHLLLQGEATITLEDVEVLTGLPTRGRPVSVGYDARAADVICQELLGATPPPTRFTWHQVKISWVKEQFDRLPAGASADFITCYARAYAWVLVGAVLLADRSGDLIPVHLLRLLCTSQKGTGDIGGFTLLVQLWALERFPYIADRYIAGGDPPIADSYPRGVRWMPIVHRHQHRVSMKLEEIRYALDRFTEFVVRILIPLSLINLIFLIGRKNKSVIFCNLNF
ncbi:Serine/threonine-protein phosphatase 7 long form homolog [Linum perenne]